MLQPKSKPLIFPTFTSDQDQQISLCIKPRFRRAPLPLQDLDLRARALPLSLDGLRPGQFKSARTGSQTAVVLDQRLTPSVCVIQHPQFGRSVMKLDSNLRALEEMKAYNWHKAPYHQASFCHSHIPKRLKCKTHLNSYCIA